MLILNKIKVLLNSNCWRTRYLRAIRFPTPASLKYSTTKSLRARTEEPYKFTGSKAERLSMDESFYHLENRKPYRKHQAYTMAVSLAAFLIYFGFLREENQIDEWLKQRYESDSHNVNLELQYTMQYEYCRKNRMRCDEIVTKLNEIRKANGRLPLD